MYLVSFINNFTILGNKESDILASIIRNKETPNPSHILLLMFSQINHKKMLFLHGKVKMTKKIKVFLITVIFTC